MSKVFVGTAGRGTLVLDDGRTMKLNGINGIATLSDGSEIVINGSGYVQIPDASTTMLVLDPPSGASTTARVTVTKNAQTQPANPTGTVKVQINGATYTTQALTEGGLANIVLPHGAFHDGAGQYTIKTSYSGDGVYSPSTATSIFTFTG